MGVWVGAFWESEGSNADAGLLVKVNKCHADREYIGKVHMQQNVGITFGYLTKLAKLIAKRYTPIIVHTNVRNTVDMTMQGMWFNLAVKKK